MTLTAAELERVSLIRSLLRSGGAADLREAAGISRTELAGRVGCHPSAIMRWEESHRVPRAGVSLRLADAYGELAGLASCEMSQ
jgi:DNA-binding XRE family transcriptional regulator